MIKTKCKSETSTHKYIHWRYTLFIPSRENKILGKVESSPTTIQSKSFVVFLLLICSHQTRLAQNDLRWWKSFVRQLSWASESTPPVDSSRYFADRDINDWPFCLAFLTNSQRRRKTDSHYCNFQSKNKSGEVPNLSLFSQKLRRLHRSYPCLLFRLSTLSRSSAQSWFGMLAGMVARAGIGHPFPY